jgi:hypothetical protein
MSEAFARDALLFAGEMFLLSAVILALAWEASQAIRHRAALRHLVWLGALTALIADGVLARSYRQIHILDVKALMAIVESENPGTLKISDRIFGKPDGVLMTSD